MATGKFKTLLERDFVLLDGAQGTELQRLCKTPYKLPEELNFTDPDCIKAIAAGYAEAGSDIICACTFGANRLKLEGFGKSTEEVIAQALTITREAAGNALVALDTSTLGQLLEPVGTLTFEEAYDCYREIFTAAEKHGADVVLLETMTDLYEMKAAMLALKENTGLPVICSMSFEANLRTFSGCPAAAMAMTLEGLGADAIGVNCSLGPRELIPVVEELLAHTTLPVMVKPNAGLPDPETGLFALSPEEFAAQMAHFAKMGVRLLGGCCGTSPAYIRALREALSGVKPAPRDRTIPAAVCSGSRIVTIDQPRIIGERINPTGKKLFKQALLDHNIDYILRQAVEQAEAGAEILDVNVGLPDLDEAEMMVACVKAIQAVSDLPLQLDSTKPEVLSAALRVYNGKPIVNSVNGEDEVLDAVLPLVKKYGAAVLGLTLDKNGIPKKAEERLAITEKILTRALAHGIPRRDVYIDCLTLTASAEQDAVMETLRAVRLVKDGLGLKTVLGVSNISFGLPCRETLNHTFLAMAMAHGLDLPIINPNIAAMTGTVRAFRLLAGHDRNSAAYIKAYADKPAETRAVTGFSGGEATEKLAYAVSHGLKAEAGALTRGLIGQGDALSIVSEQLIPALDGVGKDFEAGRIFLPQLILAAEAAGAAFDEIKKHLAETGGTPAVKGQIIMATVQGDIHDIGKNIVKILLENYGYQVLDLGKDVPPEVIVEAAIARGIRLVGLSALMTTTLPAMEATIRLLKKSCPDCRVMVGGAVLDAAYAERIGADYYAKDAMGAVEIAKGFFG